MAILRTPKKQVPKQTAPRRRDGPSTENAILETAENLFARYGFDGVSTKQLANEAGVAIGALYHHFPSKEAIYAAVTRRAFALRSAMPKKLVESKDPPERRLVAMVTWFVRHVLLDKTFGLLLKRELLDPRPSTPHLLDKDHFQQQLGMFKDLIRQVAPHADTDEAVATMLALIFGFANLKGIYALFPGVRKTLDTPEEMAEYATSVMLRGLKA